MGYLRKFSRLRSFAKDQEGSIAVEAVLVFPILFWAYLATFVYFDAFRVQSTTIKAAYTISDQVSRETGYITPKYLDAIYRLHEFLTTSNEDTKLRISVVTYDATSKSYKVRWSQQRGNAGVLTNSNISSIVSQLPTMPANEVVVVVQSWLEYEPMFTVGLDAYTIENLVVTRPRFNSAQLCYNSSNTGGSSTATC